MSATRLSNRLRSGVLTGAAAAALTLIVMPVLLVVWLAFFRQEIPSFPPEGYTLDWFRVAAQESKFVDGFLLSLRISVIATVLGLLLSIPAALALDRFSFRGKNTIGSALALPLVVPGIVLGTALYIFEVRLEMSTDLPVIGSTFGLVASHVLIVIPWCMRLITASLGGLDRGVEDAAMNLGATPFVTFYRVILPNIRPGIVAAALFGFVVSFGNLEMTLFLVGPGQTTLPIAILQYLEWKIDPAIAAASTVQIVLICCALFITDRYVKLSRVV